MIALRRTELSSGMRVVSAEMRSSPACVLGVWVENGSRYESDEQAGISHLIEHLLFKGTNHRSADEIAQQIDDVGGTLEAFTGKEYSACWARVRFEDEAVARDVLADVLTRSRFDRDAVVSEREVIVQELREAENNPEDRVHELFCEHFWRGHQLARPSGGTVESLARCDRRAVVDFFGSAYRANRIIVSAAGNVDHASVCEWADLELAGLSGRSRQAVHSPPKCTPGVTRVRMRLNQAHLCLGVPGLSQSDPDWHTALLLNSALGGNASSRLYRNLVHEQALASHTYSALSAYSDTGAWVIYAAGNPDRVERVARMARQELLDVARHGLSDAELERAKAEVLAAAQLEMDNSKGQMQQAAKHEIYHRNVVDMSELRTRIDGVRLEDVARLARRLVQPSQMALVVLGDVGRSQAALDRLLTA